MAESRLRTRGLSSKTQMFGPVVPSSSDSLISLTFDISVVQPTSHIECTIERFIWTGVAFWTGCQVKSVSFQPQSDQTEKKDVISCPFCPRTKSQASRTAVFSTDPLSHC